MNWKKLMKIKAWSPVKKCGIDFEFLKEGIYKLGDGAYALTSAYNKSLIEDVKNGPFVNNIFWALDDGAIYRCILQEIECFDERTDISRPPEELTIKNNITYGDLIKSAKTGKYGKYMECAAYRADGKFVHKIIDVGKLSYFFLDNAEIKDELPYSIRCTLA